MIILRGYPSSIITQGYGAAPSQLIIVHDVIRIADSAVTVTEAACHGSTTLSVVDGVLTTVDFVSMVTATVKYVDAATVRYQKMVEATASSLPPSPVVGMAVRTDLKPAPTSSPSGRAFLRASPAPSPSGTEAHENLAPAPSSSSPEGRASVQNAAPPVVAGTAKKE